MTAKTGTSESLWSRFKAWHGRAFAERQIILRSEGRVRFVTMSTRLQTVAAATFFVGTGWFVYSSLALVNADYAILARDRAIQDRSVEVVEARIAYNDLIEQVRSYHHRFSQVSTDLADSQSKLLDVLGENEDLKENLYSARGELQNVKQSLTSTHGELESVRQSLMSTSGVLETVALEKDSVSNALTTKDQVLDGLLDQNLSLKGDLVHTRKRLNSVEVERQRVAARAEQLTNALQSLEMELQDMSGRNVTLESGLNSLETQIARVNEERTRAVEQRKILENRVNDLEDRIASMQRSQQDFLLHLTERTIGTIDEAERTIAMTGLGVEMLLARAQAIPVGQGGPFVEVVSSEMLVPTELKHEVSVLDSHMERWERLQYILRTLPLTAPVDYYHVSSPFGKRKDPLNKRWAMHYGTDLAAPMRSPILATSSGVVSFAGWNANYGRMVEIDHGMGIKTRFAHMREINVKKGDRVLFREKIGLVGSSGRSTGPHVHYEILVDGKPVDPANFMKAGKYVFKG